VLSLQQKYPTFLHHSRTHHIFGEISSGSLASRLYSNVPITEEQRLGPKSDTGNLSKALLRPNNSYIRRSILLTGRPLLYPQYRIRGTAPTNMSDGTPRKRDRLKRVLRGSFKLSEAPKDKPSKKTKEKNTGNSQRNLSTAISSSASVLTPRYQTATPSTHLVTTIESSLEAQSRGAIRNEIFPSDSASQFGQTPVTATEHTAHAQVGKKEEQPHNSTATSIVKAQSLWSKAFHSEDLNQQRETLKGIGFQANALESVSEARSFVEKLLNDKKKKAWKIEKLLNWMDRFKEIGDIVVQFDPVHAALPWAAFRLLLKVDYTARSLDWTC
jgi:hypothetical protein